jgi:glucosylceramidase
MMGDARMLTVLRLRCLWTVVPVLMALTFALPARAVASSQPPAHHVVSRRSRRSKTPCAKVRTHRRRDIKASCPAEHGATAKLTPTPTPAPAGTDVQVVQTTQNLSDALTAMPSEQFSARPTPGVPVLNVDDSVRYQKMTGFGAAMTDTSAWLLYTQLSPQTRAQVFANLFGPEGINLDYVRVPMGASDFTATGVPYSYDDLPAGQTDPTLADFSVAHDEAYIIPALQEMLSVNPTVWILANPWSPPPWMKANDAFDNSQLAGTVLPQYYPALAQYFVKFIQAYESQGIPTDAITTMNEPESLAAWPGAALLPADEAVFLPQDLEPALQAAGLDVPVFGLDDANLADAQSILQSPAAADLAGIAVHCYQGMSIMSTLHAQYRDVPIIENECSPGIIPYPTAEVGIDATRNWASGVQLWNLALDPSGGPVQPPNYGCRNCTGVVTVHEQTHQVTYGRNYYQLGQLSKFVARGAQRIDSGRFVSDFDNATGHGVTAGLDNVAFINPDGTRVLAAYNNSAAAQLFQVAWDGKYMPYTLAPGATVTFTWN